MVFPFMFDDIAALVPLKPVAGGIVIIISAFRV
jgi:hypothetical protein